MAMKTTAIREFLSRDLDMLNFRTLEFGPGRITMVKYSFFLAPAACLIKAYFSFSLRSRKIPPFRKTCRIFYHKGISYVKDFLPRQHRIQAILSISVILNNITPQN